MGVHQQTRMPVARQLALLLLALQTVWAGSFPLRILSWNVHWQCGSDHIPDCRARAIQRFVALAAQHHASMVVSIELEANDTTPIDLPSHGLTGWVQYNGSCPGPSSTQSGDVAAVSLAPGFRILRAGGGCMGGADARAFAVALVMPPTEVHGCPDGVCLIGLHAPHGAISRAASDQVAAVCGTVRQGCTIASGDWNAPVSSLIPLWRTVPQLWQQLVNTSSPITHAVPDVNTCCYPETKYRGHDDHVVTDIVGADGVAEVLPYQMQAGDTEEHKPIVVNLTLPEL